MCYLWEQHYQCRVQSYVHGMSWHGMSECCCSQNFVMTSGRPHKALSLKVKLLSLWHALLQQYVLSPIVVFGMLAHTVASRTTHVVISDMLWCVCNATTWLLRHTESGVVHTWLLQRRCFDLGEIQWILATGAVATWSSTILHILLAVCSWWHNFVKAAKRRQMSCYDLFCRFGLFDLESGAP